MSKTFLLALVLSAAAVGQPFGVGLKLGVPLTDALSSTGLSTHTNRYMVGPYAEIRLPLSLSIEVDALYRSFDFQPAAGASTNSVGSWEFPVLAKYKLFKGPVKPYLEGGLVFSRLTGIKDLVDLNHKSNYGIALGAGLEIHLLMLRISPEIRYDGFVFTNIQDPAKLFQSNRNQAMVLVGIGF
jgi:opacity protein-like surface antigen